jgi:hypothetical protein
MLLHTHALSSTKRAVLYDSLCILTCVNYFNEVLLPFPIAFD